MIYLSRRVVRLLLFALVAFLIMKVSSIGFKPTKSRELKLESEDLNLVENLEKTTRYLSQELGIRDYLTYDNLEKSAKFIEAEFRGLGYKIQILEYQIDAKVFKNIIALKKSKSDKNKTIVIGAHYDTCSNPGADDNASGIAGLIELARMFKNEDFKQDIEFVAFVNEEPPFFMTEDMGSRVYVNQAKREHKAIECAIILESIGYYSDKRNSQHYIPPLGLFYPNQGNFIALVGNIRSRKLVFRLAKSFKKNSSLPLELIVAPQFIPAIDFSDHWSFWKERIPAVMFTDTAFLRNPNYHNFNDLAHTLDYQRMALFIKGLGAAIIDLSKQR